MTTKVHWESTDLAREELIEPLLEDIGIGEDDKDSQVKTVTRQYALRAIKSWPEDEPFSLTMGDLDTMVESFASGYEECLMDLGLRPRIT